MSKLWLLVCAVVCAIGLGGCTTFNDLTATQITPCTNGVRDTGELGVDCGPVCSKTCDGQVCTADTECASGKCSGTCGPSANKKCGIGLPNPCNDGEVCGLDGDCAGDFCDATCKAPGADVHTDGRRNGGETGTDCGGTAPPCAAGETCKTNDDCQGVCQGDKTCAAPSPTDGKKNGDETDVDCGGANAPKCVLDKVCLANADCELDACTAGTCVTPTATDGIQNGGETAIDCGGNGVSGSGITYQAPRCTVDKGCIAGTDCLTGSCSPGLKCQLPSCATAETAGITSCGAKETGEAGAVHDSCCTSLVLPTRTTRRLDKYEITAGRFRSFITKAGPNLRAWATQYAAAHPTSQLASLMASFPVVTSILPKQDLADDVSLTAHLSLDIDNYNGVRGCFNDATDGATSFGANTYWQDATHGKEFGTSRSPQVPRTTSDEKPMNCVMPLLFTAFCAWDGGELATTADYADVWPTTQTYPWGATNFCTKAGGQGSPGGYFPCDAYNWCNGPTKNGGFECQDLTLTSFDEPGIFYEFPKNTDRAKDNEPLIASPGRFPKDLTAAKSADGQGWFDLFGNLAEYTGDFVANTNAADVNSTFCDRSSDPQAGAATCSRTDPGSPAGTPPTVGTLFSNIPQVGVLGSTWEGHQYGNFNPAMPARLPITFQYGKFGARCVRPAAAY